MKVNSLLALVIVGTISAASSAMAECPYNYKAITPYTGMGISRAENVKECAKDPAVIKRATERLYEDVVLSIRRSDVLSLVAQEAEIAAIDKEELKLMEQSLWNHYAKVGTKPEKRTDDLTLEASDEESASAQPSSAQPSGDDQEVKVIE